MDIYPFPRFFFVLLAYAKTFFQAVCCRKTAFLPLLNAAMSAKTAFCDIMQAMLCFSGRCVNVAQVKSRFLSCFVEHLLNEPCALCRFRVRAHRFLLRGILEMLSACADNVQIVKLMGLHFFQFVIKCTLYKGIVLKNI